MINKTTMMELVESLASNIRFETERSIEELNAKVVSENIKEGDTVAILGVVRGIGFGSVTIELHGQATHAMRPKTCIQVPMATIRLDVKEVEEND